MADRKTLDHFMYRVATRRQFFNLPNIDSILLRRLKQRVSYFTAFFRCFPPGMQERFLVSLKGSLNQSAL